MIGAFDPIIETKLTRRFFVLFFDVWTFKWVYLIYTFIFIWIKVLNFC